MEKVQSMAPDEPSVSSQRATWQMLAKIAFALAALTVLIVMGRRLGGYIPQFAAWVDSLGIWGPAAFILGYAVATVAFIPGSLLTLAAGAIFGLLKGTLIVFVGATLGSGLAFLVARYVARQKIEARIENSPRFAAIDQAVAREGLKIVFLLRLSPVFPYNLLNYALGLTRVNFRDYMAAAIGMIPATFLYVYYGKAIGSIAAVASGAQVERGLGYWAVLSVGLLATLVVTTVVTRIARKALSLEVQDDA